MSRSITSFSRHIPLRIIVTGVFLIWLFLFIATVPATRKLQTLYESQESRIVRDRNGVIIRIEPNEKGFYAQFTETIPPQFAELLLKKEDQWFLYHPGINPIRIAADFFSYIIGKKRNGSSTLTQQLVKTLLGNENDRTVKNKVNEAWYSLALELHATKNDILTMYANTAFFGEQSQGIAEASRHFFGKPPETLNDEEIVSLIITLANPTNRHPGTAANTRSLPEFAQAMRMRKETVNRNRISPIQDSKRSHQSSFELSSLHFSCGKECKVSLDVELSSKLRSLLADVLASPDFKSVSNGAIVVLSLPDNEILALIGSPDPRSSEPGNQINMAVQPRPIGSTLKPFIYARAFEKGARPYTLADDREYRYTIGTGFAFYPRNYDGSYRGLVTLHEALANSLNVPSVKVLEYVGTRAFAEYVEDVLGFRPIQSLENYGIGLALGSLEMDLLTLTHYFSVFPSGGMLRPLTIGKESHSRMIIPSPMGLANPEEKRVLETYAVALINKILSDRHTGVEQFGIKSSFNLPFDNYALKTGTSRDFHDSWTIGYTPDFVVGVWIGNHDNTPMHRISGQIGAGKLWSAVMEIMLNSSYNRQSSFDFGGVKEFADGNSLEYGLGGDDYEFARNVLLDRDNALITHPHDNDVFLFSDGMTIPLEARQDAAWYVNGVYEGQGRHHSWKPKAAGQYEIAASASAGKNEAVTVRIDEKQTFQ